MSADKLVGWERERAALWAEANGKPDDVAEALLADASAIETRIVETPIASLAGAAVKLGIIAEIIGEGSDVGRREVRILREVMRFLHPTVPDPHMAWWRAVQDYQRRIAELEAVPEEEEPEGHQELLERLESECWELVELLSRTPPVSLEGAAARLQLWLLMIAEDDGSQWVDGLDRRTHEMVADWLVAFAGTGETG